MSKLNIPAVNASDAVASAVTLPAILTLPDTVAEAVPFNDKAAPWATE